MGPRVLHWAESPATESISQSAAIPSETISAAQNPLSCPYKRLSDKNMRHMLCVRCGAQSWQCGFSLVNTIVVSCSSASWHYATICQHFPNALNVETTMTSPRTGMGKHVQPCKFILQQGKQNKKFGSRVSKHVRAC